MLNLQDLKMKELREIAKDLGIEKIPNKKDDLINVIENNKEDDEVNVIEIIKLIKAPFSYKGKIYKDNFKITKDELNNKIIKRAIELNMIKVK